MARRVEHRKPKEPEHDRIVREAQKPGMQYNGLSTEGGWATPILVAFVALLLVAFLAVALVGAWELLHDTSRLLRGD